MRGTCYSRNKRVFTEYMVDRLKMLCEEVIERAVSEKNVVQLLDAAERYNARRLRAACIACVAAQPKLLDTPPFQALPAQLLTDLRCLLGQ